MKKTLALAVIAVFLMIPLASFAKTAMSDSDLGAVAGKEGVSIKFGSFSTNNNWGLPGSGASTSGPSIRNIFLNANFFPFGKTFGIFYKSNANSTTIGSYSHMGGISATIQGGVTIYAH